MKTTFTTLGVPALLGLFLVLPLVLLEMINRPNPEAAFPVPLFGIMWLLATVFFLILIPIVRSVGIGKNITAHPIVLVASVICLVLIAALWGAILLDQMPCFLGVPNCD